MTERQQDSKGSVLCWVSWLMGLSFPKPSWLPVLGMLHPFNEGEITVFWEAL